MGVAICTCIPPECNQRKYNSHYTGDRGAIYMQTGRLTLVSKIPMPSLTAFSFQLMALIQQDTCWSA